MPVAVTDAGRAHDLAADVDAGCLTPAAAQLVGSAQVTEGLVIAVGPAERLPGIATDDVTDKDSRLADRVGMAAVWQYPQLPGPPDESSDLVRRALPDTGHPAVRVPTGHLAGSRAGGVGNRVADGCPRGDTLGSPQRDRRRRCDQIVATGS